MLLATAEFAHGRQSPSAAGEAPAAKHSKPAARAFPRVELGAGRRLEYVGAFSPDGKFRPLTKLGSFVDSMVSASRSGQPEPSSAPPDPAKLIEEDPTKQVPPNIQLRRNEQQVEDFQPPERAVGVAKGQSVLGEVRDSIVSLAYGPQKFLMVPQSVTTDSRRRVIVTDPVAHGVHVLAYTATESFQIVGGKGRRLQSPSGVAVDSNDNIYVSDSERGMILVYDSEGRFLHAIGSSGDEGLFERPSALAIDSKAGRLYILDPPRHLLFIFDLKGNVLARIGAANVAGFSSRVGSTEPGKFSDPKAVFVHNDELLVLDSTRVQILDLQGNFLKEFKVSSGGLPNGPSPGLFMDDKNHIYISDPGSGIVRVYDHDGNFQQAFGRPGTRMGEFYAPAGMWADSTALVYIVDARRVQIFRFTSHK
jgi:sugar lactone lactonase YvrE